MNKQFYQGSDHFFVFEKAENVPNPRISNKETNIGLITISGNIDETNYGQDFMRRLVEGKERKPKDIAYFFPIYEGLVNSTYEIDPLNLGIHQVLPLVGVISLPTSSTSRISSYKAMGNQLADEISKYNAYLLNIGYETSLYKCRADFLDGKKPIDSSLFVGFLYSTEEREKAVEELFGIKSHLKPVSGMSDSLSVSIEQNKIPMR